MLAIPAVLPDAEAEYAAAVVAAMQTEAKDTPEDIAKAGPMALRFHFFVVHDASNSMLRYRCVCGFPKSFHQSLEFGAGVEKAGGIPRCTVPHSQLKRYLYWGEPAGQILSPRPAMTKPCCSMLRLEFP